MSSDGGRPFTCTRAAACLFGWPQAASIAEDHCHFPAHSGGCPCCLCALHRSLSMFANETLSDALRSFVRQPERRCRWLSGRAALLKPLCRLWLAPLVLCERTKHCGDEAGRQTAARQAAEVCWLRCLLCMTAAGTSTGLHAAWSDSWHCS